MDNLLKAEEAYFKSGKVVFSFDNKDNSLSNVQLDYDVISEISTYLGKISGLLSKYFRKKWLERGIYTAFDFVINHKFPGYLLGNVTNLIIKEYIPTEETIKLFPNLKEINMVHVNFHRFCNFNNARKMFKNLERVIIGEDETYISQAEYPTEEYKNLSICIGKKILKYDDYKNICKKYDQNLLLFLLMRGEPINLSSEIECSVMFSHLPQIYIHLERIIRRNPDMVPKIKLNVIISDNILDIDFYQKVLKKFYDNLNIETKIDIFGRLSDCKDHTKEPTTLRYSLFDQFRFSHFICE
jgi:hypothetical protein